MNLVLEALVEEESAPYPEIPEELLGIKTVENCKGVTRVLIANHEDTERGAMDSAENTNIAPGEGMLEHGLVTIEPDDESINEDDDPQIVENVG